MAGKAFVWPESILEAQFPTSLAGAASQEGAAFSKRITHLRNNLIVRELIPADEIFARSPITTRNARR